MLPPHHTPETPDGIFNLELHDKNAYKKSFKADFEGIELIDAIAEILGSIEVSKEKKINIVININEENIFISHDSNSLDTEDIRRLLKIATHGMKNNKKGVSFHGIGWRGIADISAQKSFEGEYKEDDFYSYSSLISKVNEDITINEDNIDGEKLEINLKNGDIVSQIIDNKYNFSFKTGSKYTDLYNNHLNDGTGVLFCIPNNFEINKEKDKYTIHKLKIWFNRIDCRLNYINNITGTEVSIFDEKSFNYIDKNISGSRYLEVEINLYKTNKKGSPIIAHLKVLDQQNVGDYKELNDKYIQIKSKLTIEEILNKWEIEDWCYDYEEGEHLTYMSKFRSRMIGFDEVNHTNEDFLKWYKFYSGPNEAGGGDGILPYIDDYCLRYKAQEFNTKNKNFKNTGKLLKYKEMKQNARTGWTRENNDKIIKFKSWQNLLCEVIIDKNMVTIDDNDDNDDNDELVNYDKKKSNTKVFNSKGSIRIIPFFLYWMNHKYVWEQGETEFKKNNEELDNKKLEKELEEKEKQRVAAEKKAKEEKQKTEKKEKQRVAAEKEKL